MPRISIKLKCKFVVPGELLEWLKRHAWKACIPQKGIEGSNPSLSASFSSPFMLLMVNGHLSSAICDGFSMMFPIKIVFRNCVKDLFMIFDKVF